MTTPDKLFIWRDSGYSKYILKAPPEIHYRTSGPPNRRLAKFGDPFGLVITVGLRNISSVICMMVDEVVTEITRSQ